MAFKDILLALTSYPDPTPVSVVEDAVSLAATLGAHLSAVSCEVRVEVPGHFLAGSIANLPGIVVPTVNPRINAGQSMRSSPRYRMLGFRSVPSPSARLMSASKA